MLLSSSHLRTLPLGIAVLQFVQFYEVDFGTLFAGLVIVMMPTLLCYIILQNQITKGITVGRLKAKASATSFSARPSEKATLPAPKMLTLVAMIAPFI